MRNVVQSHFTIGSRLQTSQLGILAICMLGSCLFVAYSPVAMADVIATESFDYQHGSIDSANGGTGWASDRGWLGQSDLLCYVCDSRFPYILKDESPLGTGRVAGFHGDHSRTVLLRRELAKPFTGETLYVRFLLRYDASTLDDVQSEGDGEFFVLWLDDIDGGDGAGHTVNAPSIGVRIPDPSDQEATPGNRFMVRINRSNPGYSPQEFEGDHTYLIVARLTKSSNHPLADYDRMELWVDPDKADALPPPDAVTTGKTINSVRWLGFSIGNRTEPQDFITVDEIVLGEQWQDVLPGGMMPAVQAKPQLAADAPAEQVDFGRQVLPLLQEKCFDCHQGQDATSGHRLDVYEELLGHFQGKALAVPGDSSNSPLLSVVVTDDESIRMPPDGPPLSEQEISLLRNWIDQGLAWDNKLQPSEAPESDHWAFRQIVRAEIPKLANNKEPQNPIDAFLRARQKTKGITPSDVASKQTLIRRITLDLTGLPPSPEEVLSFVSDESPNAVNQLIDRLLASPAYGEHWARHWLDLARWSESDGYQHNQKRPTAWRYRDYVIESIRNNKPFDQFLREQLAGDEMAPYSDENLIATGFLASARYSSNERDKAIQRNDILVDITNNTATAFLGLTLQCAQCHNHKFDPVSARDYYRFMGFFIKGQPVEALLDDEGSSEAKPDKQEVLDGIVEQNQMIAASIARTEASLRRQGLPTAVTSVVKAIKGIPQEDRERFNEIDKKVKQYNRTWAYYSPITSSTDVGVPYFERTSPLDYSLHKLHRARPVLYIRGDINTPGPNVDIGWPEVFGPVPSVDRVESKPRTALSDWLTSRKNPLTARVWVNRIWAGHFGRGIVETLDDFGTQGSRPSHPKLLDWLASELIESGWDTGHIHRLILTSHAFQQDSAVYPSNEAIDPENQLYWRWTRRRLEAESIRDSILAVAGILDRTIGGPSAAMNVRAKSLRRTIYLEQKRGRMPAVQRMFDAPPALNCCGERRTSTVALQPLYLLNDHLVLEYAQAFTDRVREEAGEESAEQINRAFQLALGRLPDKEERAELNQFIDSVSESDPQHALLYLCHAVLNLNEFLYIP